MPRLLPVLAVLLCLVPGRFSGGQEVPASIPGPPLRTFFTVRSAQPDDTLPAELRREFEKDDGSPLRSVALDLDGDGTVEKFFLCAVLAANGGSQWLVYDPGRNAPRGIIVGTIVFVGRESDSGFPRLETYWKQGGNMSVVFNYQYARGRYGRVGTRALTLWETSQYFRQKPPLDLDQELAEIK